MARPVIPLEKKFLDRLERVVVCPSSCWIWTDVLDKDGYGIVQHTVNYVKQHIRAHRMSYEYHVGPIPKGLCLDHLCRTRSCVNPRHLEAVSIRENVKRGGWSLKTHCPKGHPYDEENTYLSPGKNHRQCIACKKAIYFAIPKPFRRKRKCKLL